MLEMELLSKSIDLFVAFKIPDLHSSLAVWLMEWTFHS